MNEPSTVRAKSRVPFLDRMDTYTRLDTSGMRHRLQALPGQCRDAWASAARLEHPEPRPAFNKVVIGGMGGSAIAGDLVVDLASLRPSIPLLLVRDFLLPCRLDEKSLFVACSYSGATEETLSLFRQALQQGAAILAITGGGTLDEEARSAGVPVLHVDAPGEPRSAVGYNLMLLLGALDGLGVVEADGGDVAGAVAVAEAQVRRCWEHVPTSENPAKQLAQAITGRLVVIYGGGIFSALARRWKTQLNENAKTWAFSETLPELLHNSVEAFARQPGGGQGKMVLVLQPSAADAELEGRYRAVSGLLQERSVPHQVVKGDGGGPMAELLSMLVLGDYVSYYVALLQGLDPSPTPAINRGKELLQGEVKPGPQRQAPA